MEVKGAEIITVAVTFSFASHNPDMLNGPACQFCSHEVCIGLSSISRRFPCSGMAAVYTMGLKTPPKFNQVFSTCLLPQQLPSLEVEMLQ